MVRSEVGRVSGAREIDRSVISMVIVMVTTLKQTMTVMPGDGWVRRLERSKISRDA